MMGTSSGVSGSPEKCGNQVSDSAPVVGYVITSVLSGALAVPGLLLSFSACGQERQGCALGQITGTLEPDWPDDLVMSYLCDPEQLPEPFSA